MKAPDHFTIVITGNTADVLARNSVDNNRALGRLMGQLLSGFDVPEHCWHPWRLSVEVMEDQDQGDG